MKSSQPASRQGNLGREASAGKVMRTDSVGEAIAGFGFLFVVCFGLVIFLDGFFGIMPDHPLAESNWLWFLKPAIWAMVIMSAFNAGAR